MMFFVRRISLSSVESSPFEIEDAKPESKTAIFTPLPLMPSLWKESRSKISERVTPLKE
jgi:hypothetical protein